MSCYHEIGLWDKDQVSKKCRLSRDKKISDTLTPRLSLKDSLFTQQSQFRHEITVIKHIRTYFHYIFDSRIFT